MPLEEQDDDPSQYKGETNLRELDAPAYERRSAPLRSRQQQDGPADDADEESSEENPKIRRLQAGDLNEREDRDERARSDDEEDTDTPAFLRKMMD